MTPGHYFQRTRDDDGGHPLRLNPLVAGESPGIREALGLLSGSGVTATGMTAIVQRVDGLEAVPRLFYWLTWLQQAGHLEHILQLSDGSNARLVPQRPGRVFRDVRFDAGKTYLISRFAFVRRDDRGMLIESPLRPAVLRFRSWLPAAVMAAFGRPASCDSLAASFPANFSTDAIALIEMLVIAGFLEESGEQVSPALALWDFHELLFHVRSSVPRLGEPFGATHPHRQPEPAAVRPALADTAALALPPPRLDQWQSDDPPLARVVEDRRSAAVPGPNRPTLMQVGDFLYRTAHPQTDLHRVLPSAGARHALEFYVGVNDADGLAPGFYHYHAASHRLHKLTAADEVVAEMLRRGAAAWSSGRHAPHLLIVVAARFPRMASRYASIAYRNTLLDAGIAIEAMYLNATAMRLAPCALGINLPDLFARITGLDPFDETPVAMFALSA